MADAEPRHFAPVTFDAVTRRTFFARERRNCVASRQCPVLAAAGIVSNPREFFSANGGEIDFGKDYLRQESLDGSTVLPRKAVAAGFRSATLPLQDNPRQVPPCTRSSDPSPLPRS
jgi:hypothetical protein